MSKRKKNLVLMVPEDNKRNFKYSFVTDKSAKMQREAKILRLRKYDPSMKKHRWFVERRMPQHAK